MELISPKRHPGRGRSLARFLAFLLLALICGDITEAACDPIGIFPAAPALTHSYPQAGDPCGEFCVHDCFCCASTLPAPAAFLLLRAEIPLDSPVMPVYRSIAGYRFVPDHVPIPLS